jgi:hypothetical protein
MTHMLMRDTSIAQSLFKIQFHEINYQCAAAHQPSTWARGNCNWPLLKLTALCSQSCTLVVNQERETSNAILDGAVIVQMFCPRTARTFHEYAREVFPHITSRLQHVNRLDIVWDEYVPNSLKASNREKRGKGTRRRVLSSAHIPRNWQDFL